MKQNRITKQNHKTKSMTRLLITLMLMASLLLGCSSTEAETETAEAKPEVEATAQEPAEVEEEETVEESSKPVTDEAETEPETEAESEPEPVVYEGIDMESTLPGEEWVATFEGIINEPKMVIFNDSTNKKVIVEQGQTVDFALDDIFGIYVPDSIEIIEVQDELSDYFNSIEYSKVTKYSKLSEQYQVGDTIDTTNIYEVNGIETEFSVTLNLVE